MGKTKKAKYKYILKNKHKHAKKKKWKNLTENFKIHIYTLYFIKYKIFRKINLTK